MWPTSGHYRHCPSCNGTQEVTYAKGFEWCSKCYRKLGESDVPLRQEVDPDDKVPHALYWRVKDGVKYASRVPVKIGEAFKLERVKLHL